MNKHTSNKRVFFYCFVSFALFALIAVSRVQFSPCIGGQLKSIHDAVAGSSKGNFIDLNRRKSGQEGKVLILTPLKNAAPYITRYMDLIDALTYPKHLISIAFLVSDTTDNTIDVLRSKADVLLNSHPYNSITILEKDFNFSLTSEERHLFHLQPLRRSYMARSRNFLLNAALKYDHDWVLWLDVDVIHYPRTILHDLQSLDVDIVVPNCFRAMKDGTLVGYDKNNWQETEKSWQLQDSMDPDYVLLEGYYEFLTDRRLMVDMPRGDEPLYKVPLDGIGATFTLVKAHVHREGANFPPYVYQHQVETEGFAKIAKAMGYSIYGLPSYLIQHATND